MHAYQVTKSCLTLCAPMDHSPPCSSVHAIFQARILQWVAMPSSSGSSLIQGSNMHLFCLPYWQASSLPLAPPRKPLLSYNRVLWGHSHSWMTAYTFWALGGRLFGKRERGSDSQLIFSSWSEHSVWCIQPLIKQETSVSFPPSKMKASWSNCHASHWQRVHHQKLSGFDS